MNKKRRLIFGGMLTILFLIMAILFSSRNQSINNTTMTTINSTTKTAIFAGGCFWCVEADFEKLAGMQAVVSGYSGGSADNPNYEDYAQGGHREVVEISYDPAKTTYQNLVEHIIFYSDATDGAGSFHDRGPQYAPAIYYENDEEKKIAEETIVKVNTDGIFEKPLAIEVLPRSTFWPAETYHQDYYKKNPVRYKYYRAGSGRDTFIDKYKEKAIESGFLQSQAMPIAMPKGLDFDNYHKPSDEILKQELTPLQYDVTQKEGTEKPFQNEYDRNKAEGIYVDRISGEALFSSRDKYDSGTGWPSFVKPIEANDVVLHEDKKLFSTRTEVRSRYADSHIGHVFDDGPGDRGGKRYCMNSAALLFVPKEDMQSKGYEKYLYLFE